MPLNQLPVFEIGDRRFVQSKAISRFIAKKVGLVGANELEDMEIDGIVDTVDEFVLRKL